jgi:60 kDa SS-A/Ro ribonucleoprotein
MSNTALRNFAKRVRQTPQTEPLDARQVKNNAGGFVYATDPWKAFERFLVLGTEGGTYYVGEQKLTQDAAKNTLKCVEEDGRRAVDLLVDISDKGRAASNDPALFALALAAACADGSTRRYALAHLPRVARIPTHLFHFVQYVTGMRGWGRGLKTAVANWYNNQDANRLAFSLVKYQSRDGWSNKDLAILSHPAHKTREHDAIYNWLLHGQESFAQLYPKSEVTYSAYTPEIIRIFHQVQAETDVKTVAALVRKYNLTREMVPTQMLNERIVWEALLEKMPMTALIRNLANLTSVGLLDTFSTNATKVCDQVRNLDALKKARVHPLALLTAMKTYASGHGFRGKKAWTPTQQVVDALDEAFYLSFDTVEPTNKNLLLALDVSGSMGSPFGDSPLTCCEAASALALVTAHVEPKYAVFRFNTGMEEVPVRKGMRLDAVMRYTNGINGGGTDCALPMQIAAFRNYNVDAFCVYTDNETYYGKLHPMQALTLYRQKVQKPDAKLIVTAMVPTPFTIADPNDPNTLDVAGFDTNAPALLSHFIKG